MQSSFERSIWRQPRPLKLTITTMSHRLPQFRMGIISPSALILLKTAFLTSEGKMLLEISLLSKLIHISSRRRHSTAPT